MQFNFQRVRTPAYITSIVLVVIGLLFALGSVASAAWIFMILGVALNVTAVSVIAIGERAPRPGEPGSRVVIEPELDTEQHAAVTPAAGLGTVSSGPARPAQDEGPGGHTGSTSLRSNATRAAGTRETQPHHHTQPQGR